MKNKKAYIILGISVLTFSTLAGCSKTNNNSIMPTLSDSIIEIEIPEPVEDPEPIEEPEPTDNEEVEDNIVENVPLTQEEIESLVASAPDIYKAKIEGYQQIMETGSWVVPETGGMTCSEVVGRPGDTSWRQMTDEEAKAYQEKYPYSQIGKAELMNGTWSTLYDGKLYFNPYEYKKAVDEWNQERIDSGKAWDPDELLKDFQ